MSCFELDGPLSEADIEAMTPEERAKLVRVWAPQMGVPVGSPLAVGSGQTGKTITTSGWSNGHVEDEDV